MKSLMNIAIEEAARRDNIERRVFEERLARYGELRRRLEVLKKGVIAQVQKLEGQICEYGTFGISGPKELTELLRVSCSRSPTLIVPVLFLHGWVHRYTDEGVCREEPRIWANVHYQTETPRVVSTRKVDGIVALEPFLEDLGKALAIWF